MGFKVFAKGSAPAPTVPSVTIQKRGLISLNDAAQKLLNYPEAVQFLWDSERRVVGLQSVPVDNPNAYPVRRQNTTAGRAGRGPVLVAGTLFTKFIGLDTSIAKRYVPTMESDVLAIELDGPSQIVVANRSKKPSDEA